MIINYEDVPVDWGCRRQKMKSKQRFNASITRINLLKAWRQVIIPNFPPLPHGPTNESTPSYSIPYPLKALLLDVLPSKIQEDLLRKQTKIWANKGTII